MDEAENMLKLWQQNRGLIHTIARKYAAYDDIEDLEQQGYIGLCDAVQNYRPEEGDGIFYLRCILDKSCHATLRGMFLPGAYFRLP